MKQCTCHRFHNSSVVLDNMKPFAKSFLRTIRSTERKLDFISELPLEMSQLILRKLDPESLLRAAQVSRRWMNICRSDPRLKTTARRYKKTREAKENFTESQKTSTSLARTRYTDGNVRKNIELCDILDYVQCIGRQTIIYRIDDVL